MSPKASVVIPVYNAEKTLRRTVESLVYGKEKNIEIILVDDCSKDNSWNVCIELQDEFEVVKCVRNDKNSGVSHTRNHGISKVTAPYIIFVDSDDWVSEEYVSKLLDMSLKYEKYLPVCGFHFLDQTNNTTVDYLWDNESNQNVFFISDEELFKTVDKIMIQSCWNKIFERDVIEKYHIQFDENQCMGEDFEFVLDYMNAANRKQCAVLNEALYYYIRSNSDSLMGKFGWISDQSEILRIKKIAQMCQQRQEVEIISKNMCDQIKNNWAYHVVRSKNRSNSEKRKRLEEIFGKEQSKERYNAHMKIYRKEELLKMISGTSVLFKRIGSYIERGRQKKLIEKMKGKLSTTEITIISQNCIGGVFYHDMGMKFQSPTVNLFFTANDFVKFVSNLDEYISMPIEVEWKELWPVGYLGDVAIEFMHYKNCKEAKESWERRKERIKKENILIVATDRDGFDEDIFLAWKEIQYPKILFSANELFSKDADTVYFPKYNKEKSVADLISKREFYKDNILVKKVNQIGKNRDF